jgi:hypothetical protein
MKLRIFVFVTVLVVVSGCGAGGRHVKTELYFGMLKADGTKVSRRQWQEFVDEYVTPRFQQGLTMVDAEGQWLGKEDELIKEKTKILIILHRDNRQAQDNIEEIRDKYKELFEQEEVLRISSYVNSN